MAQYLDLAAFREPLNSVPALARPKRRRGNNCGNVQGRQIKRPLSRRGLFEDESFVLVDVARRFLHFSGHLDSLSHWRACLTAEASFSMSARPRVSVTHTSAWFVSSGYQRSSASGPVI